MDSMSWQDLLKRSIHKNWIKDPEYDRVDLVKEGANSEAHIKLFKSKDKEGEDDMKLEDCLKTLKKEHAEAIQEEFNRIIKEKEKIEEELKQMKENQGKGKGKGTDDEEPTEEDILKSADPAIQAIVKQAKAQAALAEKAIAKMRDVEMQKEAIEKTKDLTNIGSDNKELVELYKSLNATDSKLCEKVFEVLTKANNVAAGSDIFKEIGAAAPAGETPQGKQTAWNKIEARAAEIAKSASISKEMAISRVMDEQPELYEAYLKESLGQ